MNDDAKVVSRVRTRYVRWTDRLVGGMRAGLRSGVAKG
jgi:hypothetical protein